MKAPPEYQTDINDNINDKYETSLYKYISPTSR